MRQSGFFSVFIYLVASADIVRSPVFRTSAKCPGPKMWPRTRDTASAAVKYRKRVENQSTKARKGFVFHRFFSFKVLKFR